MRDARIVEAESSTRHKEAAMLRELRIRVGRFVRRAEAGEHGAPVLGGTGSGPVPLSASMGQSLF